MTVDRLLATLLDANLAAAAAILLVLAIRRPARRLMGARGAYGLWLIVPATALASLVPARMVTVHLPAALPAPFPAAPPEFLPIDQVAGPMPLSSVAPGHSLDPALILLAVWLAGALAVLAASVWRSRVLARNPALGPALVGVVKPRLVLPADFRERFTARERRLILAHEGVHAAARHPLINGLIELGRCLNWFNPLVHVAAFYARLDQEFACDAAVIDRHPGERRVYAETLLKTQAAPAFLPLGCQWPGRSRPMLTERIDMLASPRSTLARRLLGGGAIALLASAAGLAAWAAQPPRQNVVLAVAPAANPAAILITPVAQTANAKRGSTALVAGQRVRITIEAEPALSSDQKIAPDGSVVVPMAGKIIAAGLTPVELRQAVASGLKNYLVQPSTIDVTLPPPGFGAAEVRGAVAAGDADAVLTNGGSVDQVVAAVKALATARHDRKALDNLDQLTDVRDGGRVAIMGRSSGFDGKAGHYRSVVNLEHLDRDGAPVLMMSSDLRMFAPIPPPAFRPAAFQRPPLAPASASSTSPTITVCITNSCMKPAGVTRDEAVVAAAIKAGKTADAIRAGASAGEVGQILRALCGQPTQPKCDGLPRAGSEAWVVGPDGSIMVGGPKEDTSDGAGYVSVRNRDMMGVPARPDMPPPPVRNPNDPTPVFEPRTMPDGSVRNYVTGWRQPDGTVTSTPVFNPPTRPGG